MCKEETGCQKLEQMFWLGRAQKGDEKGGVGDLFFICASGGVCVWGTKIGHFCTFSDDVSDLSECL